MQMMAGLGQQQHSNFGSPWSYTNLLEDTVPSYLLQTTSRLLTSTVYGCCVVMTDVVLLESGNSCSDLQRYCESSTLVHYS